MKLKLKLAACLGLLVSARLFAAVAPATIIDNSSSLNSGKYSALTVDTFSGSNITVINNFIAHGNTTLLNSSIKGTSQVDGDLNVNNSTFKNSVKVLGKLNANNSHFSKGLSFGGSQAKLQNSKLIGNLNSSSESPVTIILSHTTIKGNINFAQAGGVVLASKSKLTGQISNGTLQQQ